MEIDRCGHCKQLTPIWEEAAKHLKGVVGVGAVDADVAAAKRVATKAGDVSPKSLTGGPGSSVSSGD